MAQIQSPETYADGQQVTAARLNNQTNGAILLPGAITDQTNIAANTVASGDSVLLYDLSATGLREANVSDVLGSNVPVTTSAITAGANSDIVVTPNDGVIVTGQAYTSGDGLTVTVTSTAHTLTVGQVILVTAAAAGYNGTFRVATVAPNSFTYVMTTAATAGSSTLSYTKKGAIRNAGSESIDGSLFVAGSTNLSGDINLSGATSVSGATTVSGALTSTGTANFTGQLQVNGTVGYVLTEIVEQNMSYTGSPASGAWTNCFTSSSYIKPAGEIWVLEVDFRFRTQAGVFTVIRFNQTSTSTTLNGVYNIEGAGSDYFHCENSFLRYVVSDATTFTSTFTLDVQPSASGYVFTIGEAAFPYGYFSGVTLPVSKFRIYKYKTA